MTCACLSVILTALLISIPGESRGEAAFLHISGADGPVVVDADTIPAGETVTPREPGLHFLTYLPRQNEARWKPPLADFPLQLEEGDTLRVDLGRTVSVRIESKPEGCTVKRARTLVGSTPLVLSTLSGFPDTLTLTLPGYLPAAISPTGLSDGSTFSVFLVREQGMPPIDHSSDSREGRSKGAILRYSSLAASLASISLGFWYKQKADSYYEDYLSHGNPETLEKLYRKSVELDDRARAFWIAGEAGAIITSCLFLRDFLSREKGEERAHGDP